MMSSLCLDTVPFCTATLQYPVITIVAQSVCPQFALFVRVTPAKVQKLCKLYVNRFNCATTVVAE